jgi:murein DD-endopeptidase MepM/ murein hydrolase activator NlpD
MPAPLSSSFPVTTPYGTPGRWAAGYHTGDDYSTRGIVNVPVRATRAGTVVAVGRPWGPAYGLTVVIEGPRRRVRHGYCHLSGTTITVGTRVVAGQVIAGSGNTGRSTGPHLHYEERRAPFRYGDDRRPRFSKP